MTTWTESIREKGPFGSDIVSIKAVGRDIPVPVRGGKLPYCIHQAPSRDGTVQGVRCGVERWLCGNCERACTAKRGRV